MRAYEIVSDKGPAALALTERPAPSPGPGEVLVRMRANAINYRDLATIEDPVARGLPYPRIPNSDGAGEVVAVGPGVTSVAPGDRVASCFFQAWRDGPIDQAAMDSALGGALDGVLAELVVLKEAGVIPVPDHLDFGEAATLPCAGLTAWNCLFDQGGLRAGQTVLLLGTGGVSVFALQFARMCGARAIITSSSNDKLDRIRELGAWAAINYHETPDWQDAVLDLTGGRGVDVTVEVGGAGTLERSIAATKIGGTISLVGILTGGTINPVLVMRKSIRLQGVYVGSRRMFTAMNAAIAANRIHPVIDQRFDFDEAREAYKAMREAGHFGKLVIDIP